MLRRLAFAWLTWTLSCAPKSTGQGRIAREFVEWTPDGNQNFTPPSTPTDHYCCTSRAGIIGVFFLKTDFSRRANQRICKIATVNTIQGLRGRGPRRLLSRRLNHDHVRHFVNVLNSPLIVSDSSSFASISFVQFSKPSFRMTMYLEPDGTVAVTGAGPKDFASTIISASGGFDGIVRVVTGSTLGAGDQSRQFLLAGEAIEQGCGCRGGFFGGAKRGDVVFVVNRKRRHDLSPSRALRGHDINHSERLKSKAIAR